MKSGRIPSTKKMVEQLDAKLEDMAILDARARGLSDVEIVKAVRLVRERRASLHMQGSPLLYRDGDDDIHNPTDPTHERRRKANGYMGAQTMGRGETTVLKRYRVKSPLEAHGDKLPEDMRRALELFMNDSAVTARFPAVDLNRTGVATPGQRLGGLGEVPQLVRDRHARFCWVWGRLMPELQDVANALVTRDKKIGESLYRLEDYGREIFPSETAPNRQWGVGLASLYYLAAFLKVLYGSYAERKRA